MKPSDVYVGVIDFFAVILPGSVAAWLLKGPFDTYLVEELKLDLWSQLDDAAKWATFALAAYFLGRLLFLLGKGLDSLYDLQRRRRRPPDSDGTYKQADKLRQKLAGELPRHFSTFKWAKAYLKLKAPEARSEVDQLEASSKFFRSLTVLFTAIACWLAVGQRPLHALAAGGLSYACFLGFYDHRWKCTELAYAYSIIVAKKPPKKGEGSDGDASGDE